jgi:hypothetical protein
LGVFCRPSWSATLQSVDDELISREELTATLFSIADIREDVGEIKRTLDEDDGEAQEEDT